MSQLKGYTVKQLQTAVHLLEQYNSASDAEVLHQLRVSLKKVKAVLEYLRAFHPKKIQSLRKKLQVVFHAAGSVREAQLHLKWLTEKGFQFIIEHANLYQKVKEDEELFVTQKQGHLKKIRSVSDELDRYLKQVGEDDLLQYAIGLKEKIEEKLLNVAKADLHTLRKQCKQLLYAQHWVNELNKLKLLPVVEYKKLDQLQEKIGNWHDAVDLLQWLTDGEFFLSKDKSVKQQFNKAFNLVEKDIEVKEKLLMKGLQAIKKPAKRK